MKTLYFQNWKKIIDFGLIKGLFLMFMLLILAGHANAQLITANTYRHNAANTGPVGILPTKLIGSGNDDSASAVTNIGFTFWFAGTPYTQFSVDVNGLMKLGSTAIVSEPVNSIASALNVPKIAPYWDDLSTGTNGSVSYYLGGTAPNRVLYVNWNVTVPKNTTGAANAVFQVQLYEATGNVHFAFGPTYPATNAAGYSMGIGVSAADWASVTVTGNTSASATYGGTPNNSNTMTPGNGSVKRYQFGTDATAPVINNNVLVNIPNTVGTANRTLAVVIQDQAGVPVTGIPTAGSFVPRIYYKKNVSGTWVSTPGLLTAGNGTSGTWTFTVDHSLLGGVATGDQIYYYVIAQDQADYKGSPNIKSNPAGAVATEVNTVSTPPTGIPYYIIGGAYSGIKTVGTGGDFESLSNPGGLFDQINSGQLDGNLTVNIISDLTAETGSKGLNAWVNGAGGPYTLTINPVGHRIVSGITINGGTANLITLTGVTGFTLDGLDDGTNSLTIVQTAGYYVGSAIDLKSASNNTITRLTINGYGASNYAISLTNSTAACNNNTISYCNITNPVNNAFKAGYGIGLLGSATLAGDNNIIDHNTISNFVYLSLNMTGKFSNTQISNNDFFNSLPTSLNSNFKCINIGSAVSGTTHIFNNKLHDILLSATTAGSIPLIYTSGGSGTTTNIYNNVIYPDISFTHPAETWYGIQTAGVGAVNIYFNTIYIGGSNITAGSSYGIYRGSTGTTNILNNIVFNARSNSSGTGKHYGLYTTNTTSLTSNYNDVYITGTGGFFGFSTLDRLTLTDWQTATGKDANSLSIFPQFSGPSYLLPFNAALASGTPIVGYTNDIEGTLRNVSTPSMGAYEVSSQSCTDPTAGGTIGNDQNGCGAFDPDTIRGLTPPTGAIGTIEYKWQQSVSPFTSWTDINSNTEDYKPSVVTDSIKYKRLARVYCMPDWSGAVESNVVLMTTRPSYNFNETHTICIGETYNWHGTDYTLPGIYTDNFTTLYGCDSNYTLNLYVSPLFSSTEDYTICNGDIFNWHGTDYTLAGTYIAAYFNAYGCDSTYTLNLSVNPSYSFAENHSICEGQSYNWRGIDYDYSGTYFDNYTTINGCDSSYILNLTVNPIYQFVEDVSTCAGETYNWHGTDYSTAGTYYANYLTTAGCDSNYILNLTYNPVYTTTENYSICEGQTYNWHGMDYTTAGTFTEYNSTVFGCDSSFTLNLTVNPVYAFTENHSICNGQTFNWHGVDYTTAGTYTDNHLSIFGCDSSYTLNLTVNPVYAFVENQIINNGQTYHWQGADYSTTGTYYANYSSINGCDSTYTLHLIVNDGTSKILSVKVFLEGLYAGSGTMNQAQGDTGPQYAAGIADKVSVELHSSTAPYGIFYEQNNVDLHTDGTLQITNLPGSISGTYYITIKHRNSIETWSALPFDFTGAGPFSYDFSTAASQAYGNNQKLKGNDWVIFAGDATQDGIVDGSDMSVIDNGSQPPILHGYYPEDVNGDGIVDGSDMTIIDNNSAAPAARVLRP